MRAAKALASMHISLAHARQGIRCSYTQIGVLIKTQAPSL